jgi:hypothetical protein
VSGRFVIAASEFLLSELQCAWLNQSFVHREFDIVDPWDIGSIVDAIKISLSDDLLVDNAAKINKNVISKNYNLQTGLEKMRELYS